MTLRIATTGWGGCRRLGAATVAAVLAGPISGFACATCFGASDEKMADGMNMGIAAMLLVVAAVLGGVLTAGIVIVNRARRFSDDDTDGTTGVGTPESREGRP